MARADRIVAFTWHQRTSALDTRERLLALLTNGVDRVVLATCHRVELYAAIPLDLSAGAWLNDAAVVRGDRAAMSMLEGADALAHLFAVAAGLDSAVVGEPQILAQVRRAYASATHPLLVAALGAALHVGRAVRGQVGLSSTRSVGSLAVDALLAELARPEDAAVLVVGAGEMGKLALRALVRRVSSVVVANRDLAKARALADTYGATAVALADVPAYLRGCDAVLSAADTRGEILTAAVLAPRVRERPLAVIDIAVPRSVGPDARALLGTSYRSVDDLPGAMARVPAPVLAAAQERCLVEARQFIEARRPERAAAIRELRGHAEQIRREKLTRAMKRLGHLSDRDRRIVEALSGSLTNALMHAPTVALRQRGPERSAR